MDDNTHSRKHEEKRFWLWTHVLALMGEEQWVEAIEVIDRLRAFDDTPENLHSTYRNLAVCHQNLAQYDEALAALAEAERSAEHEADVIYSRGVINAVAGRLEKAVEVFEAFRRLQPEEARALDVRQTIRDLRRAQKGKLPATFYRYTLLETQLETNMELGDLKRMEEKARQLIALDPERPEGHFYLGQAVLTQERPQEALAAFKAAYERDSEQSTTLYYLGVTCLKLEEPAEALSWLKRARRQDPTRAEILYQLGQVYERLSERKRAVSFWQKTLRLAPDHYPAQERLHEVGAGPEPEEPKGPISARFKRMRPLVRAQMSRPQIFRNEELTLTVDTDLGYMFEDADNPRNVTVYTGAPFNMGVFKREEEVLDVMGMVKMFIPQLNETNTRDFALLVYYYDRPPFNYELHLDPGGEFIPRTEGQFVTTERPRLFKLRIDSDLSSPLASPMRGKFLYLDQGERPGVVLDTFGYDPGLP